MTGAANRGGHVLRHPLAVSVRAGLFEISLEKFQDPRKAEALFAFGSLPGLPIFTASVPAVRRRIPVQQHALNSRRKFLERCIEAEAVRVRAKLQRALQDRRARPWSQPAIEKRTCPIIDNLRRIEIVFRTEPIARAACPTRRIEPEGQR